MNMRSGWIQIPGLFNGTVVGLLLFSMHSLVGQETTEPILPDQNQSEEIPDTPDPDLRPDSDDESMGPGLIEESLEVDIKTSGREELVAWCKVLNLPYDGGLEQLKSRLLSHYSIESLERDSDSIAGNGDQVIIESAKRSEYFEVKISDDKTESIVRLSGDVVLVVNDTKLSRKHRVQADTIIFNEEKKTISAIGNIEYIVDNKGREEIFTGDSLTFEVSDWTGIIFHGTSRRHEEIDGKDVPFFFRGESIKRASTDILLLTDGSISSYDIENPDYAFKAAKIWITGPGEWSILSATISVGHIPVLYLPFYWKSGRDLLFNPVIGERNNVGYYIQTTTYFMGQKEDDDDFSMLGFGDSAGADYELVREGLYLVKKKLGTEKKEDTKKETGTLKYILDAYTGLGAVTGFYGAFPKLWKDGSLDFHASIGVSRSIDDTGGVYFNEGSTSKVYWNNSYIGSESVPFRWSSSIKLKYKTWNLGLSWHSDPFFAQDFGDRKENFDWMKLLLGEEDSTEKSTTTNSMSWALSGSYRFNIAGASPWISNLSFPQIRASLTWKNKDNQSITSSVNPDRLYDPARKFFYPDKLVLPDIKFSFQGALPNFTLSRIKKEAEENTESNEQKSGDADSESDVIDIPVHISAYNTVYNSKLLDLSFSYGLDSQFYMDDQLLNTAWTKPEEVSFKMFKPAKINTIHTGKFQYGMNLWEGFLKVNGATRLSGYYQFHRPVYGTDDIVDEKTKLSDFKYSKFLWDNSASVDLKLFQGIQSLSTSYIKYEFDANILSYVFQDNATVDDPEYQLEWIENAEDVKKHTSLANIIYKVGIFSINSTLSTNLPPLGRQYSIQAGSGLEYKGLNFSISQKNTFKDETWSHDPLNMSASWTFWDKKVTISQTALYDLENGRFTRAESNFKFWGFQARLVASYAKTYNWNKNTVKWDPDQDAFTATNLEFSYKRTIDPLPFWKNRIKMKTTLDTSWKINLAKPTDNVFRFVWTQEFRIHKFLDIKLSFHAINSSMYLYFPHWRNQLNITKEYNLFEDLAKSFNIFNPQDRLDSQFNMEKLVFSMVHHLRNWDVTLEYSGSPSINNTTKAYDWKSKFSIYIKWNPLPMFNQKTKYEDDVWSVESFGENLDSE